MRRRGVTVIAALLAAAAVSPASAALARPRAAAVAGPWQTTAHTLPGGLTGAHRTLPDGRTYWLSGSGPDLVIGLPGTALDAANANDTFWVTGRPDTTGWQRHAAANGYRLALTESLAGNWNVGGGWAGGGQDDMGYLLAVAADAAAVSGPPAAVFAAGFSAGGAMAWDACAQHPEVFTACGSASGWAPVPPAGPVDVWHTHGTADTTVPVRGGAGTRGFTFPPAYQEAALTPRGSRVVLEVSPGGHATPGWMADRLWMFWTAGR
jgi:poly(3-hydroxybutyrate) depolymerase